MSVKPSTTLLCRRRRGSIYPAVLAYASLITIIGLSALLTLRLQRRASEGEIDFSQARLHARSAIEMGMWVLETDPAWRTTLPNGVWEKDRPIGTGTYTLEGIDPNDNDLANSALHPLVLTGTGLSGLARHKTQVKLEAEIKPLSCLEVALHAANDLNFSAATLRCDQTISANNSVNASSASILSSVEAVNAINGTGYAGTTITGIASRTMPDGTVFDYYLANGTPISIYGIPEVEGVHEVVDVVISPANNPYGAATNPEGIYVIDCRGLNLEIKYCRIVGTVLLKNPGSSSAITGSVNWQPAIANYPALLVSGSISMRLDAAYLDEDERDTSFNPPGTPYEGGVDVEEDDLYPSLIKGLVHVSGNLSTSYSNTIEGVVVVGETLSATAVMDLTYDATFFDNPPPGFFEVPGMRIIAGSWKQVVD